jgi:LysM repeat protein
MVMETMDVVPTVGVSYLSNEALSQSSVADVNVAGNAVETIDDEAVMEMDGDLDYYRPDPFAFAVRPFSVLDDEVSETSEEAVVVNRPPARSEVVDYIVDEGDSVGVIARRFGLMTSTILSANDLTARSIIRPGDKLRIPPVDGVIYKVKSGDTLGGIASRLSSDIQSIAKANGLADTSTISIGMELVIPGGKLPPPKPTYKAPARITSNSIKSVISPSAGTGTSKLLWPTSARRITQYYKGAAHFGLDIGGPTGTQIYAAEDGVVLTSGWNSSGYGYMIVIDHGGGLYTRYGHFSRLLVSAGDTVQRGDVIGLMGSTGRSTGPHLHFEVLVGGLLNRRNPLDYIQ